MVDLRAVTRKKFLGKKNYRKKNFAKKTPAKVSILAKDKTQNAVINKLISNVRSIRRQIGHAKNYITYMYKQAEDIALAPSVEPLVINLMNPGTWSQIFGGKDTLDMSDNKEFNLSYIYFTMSFKIIGNVVGAFVMDVFIVSPTSTMSNNLTDLLTQSTFTGIGVDYIFTMGANENVILNKDFFKTHYHKRIYLANRHTQNTSIVPAPGEFGVSDSSFKWRNFVFRKRLSGALTEKRVGYKSMGADEVPPSKQLYCLVWNHRLWEAGTTHTAPFYCFNSIVKGWSNE